MLLRVRELIWSELHIRDDFRICDDLVESDEIVGLVVTDPQPLSDQIERY